MTKFDEFKKKMKKDLEDKEHASSTDEENLELADEDDHVDKDEIEYEVFYD